MSFADRRFHMISRGSARSNSSRRNVSGECTVAPGAHWSSMRAPPALTSSRQAGESLTVTIVFGGTSARASARGGMNTPR